MEYIGNAKIIDKKDLPKIGDVYAPVPSYGRAIKVEKIGEQNGYIIFRVWYGLPEDDRIRALFNDLSNATPFTFAVKAEQNTDGKAVKLRQKIKKRLNRWKNF